MNKLKALPMFIFGGSATIGLLQNDFEINDIIEISDTMINENAYHFHKNYPNINIISPKIWEQEGFMNKYKNIDLMFCNPPCSSLSQINRNASVNGKNNVHFYRVLNAIKTIQPKTFIIENAPTLIKLGYPILLDIVNQLHEDYNFTIIRDYAGNHNVSMKRMRTLIIAYNKKFISGIPILNMEKQEQCNCIDVLKDLYEKKINDPLINNFNLIKEKYDNYTNLYNYVKPYKSIITSFVDNFNLIKDNIDNNLLKEIVRNKEKIDNGKNIFDKSTFRLEENKAIPSMTSMSSFMHPIQNRTLTIREYARIMNYPDDFIFYPNECKTPIIQCLAQGVPANFVKYISNEVKEVFNNKRKFINSNNNYVLCFQEHTRNMARLYTLKELNNEKELNTKINKFKLTN